jgi:tetratricopeptide (TPR) repeat protein
MWYNDPSELRNSGNLRDPIAAFWQYLAHGGASLPGGRYHAPVSAAKCHLALGEIPPGREVAARAVLLDAPRAEAYAVIGESDFMRRRYEAAIPLFTAAVNSTIPLEGHVASETYYLACARAARGVLRPHRRSDEAAGTRERGAHRSSASGA